MLEAELSVWPLRAGFTSCWDMVLSEPVGVVLSSLPSLWEKENSWRSISFWIIPCQAMNCLISKAYRETDMQSQMSGGPVSWNGYTPWSLHRRAERTSSPENASRRRLERYSCLKCCCSAMLFSMLGAMCHFRNTSLSWYFDPLKRTSNITTASGFSSTA